MTETSARTTAKRRLFVFLALLAVLLCSVWVAPEETARPEPQEPLFRFVQLSDVHFDTGEGAPSWTLKCREKLERAAAQINDVIKPDFVVFTGDTMNDQNRHATLHAAKELLDKLFKVKYYAVKGNHDGPEYSKVFGKRCFTFEHKGFLFVVLGLHYIDPYNMQAATCDKLEWLKNSLAEKKDLKAVVMTHDPIVPNSYLDAPAVQKVLNEVGNVALVIQGHMHYDGWSEAAGTSYVVCPAFASDPNVMKQYAVFADRIEVQNWLVKDGKYVLGEEKRVAQLSKSQESGTTAPVEKPVTGEGTSKPEDKKEKGD